MAVKHDGLRQRASRVQSHYSPPPRFSEDRICVEEGCGARLSIYNSTNRCAIHATKPKVTAPEPDEKLTARQIAETLSVKLQTVYQWSEHTESFPPSLGLEIRRVGLDDRSLLVWSRDEVIDWYRRMRARAGRHSAV